jgi:hypothetical protein
MVGYERSTAIAFVALHGSIGALRNPRPRARDNAQWCAAVGQRWRSGSRLAQEYSALLATGRVANSVEVGNQPYNQPIWGAKAEEAVLACLREGEAQSGLTTLHRGERGSGTWIRTTVD